MGIDTAAPTLLTGAILFQQLISADIKLGLSLSAEADNVDGNICS